MSSTIFQFVVKLTLSTVFLKKCRRGMEGNAMHSIVVVIVIEVVQ